MFEFLSMVDNYEERKVANNKIGEAEIDTAEVDDSDQPYETGIAHRMYNGGYWVIVEMYDTIEEAKQGHKKWCKKFENGLLPNSLTDVGTSTIAKCCNLFAQNPILERENYLQLKR